MLFYVSWDTYHMTLSTNRKILFRTDLLIHHIVGFTIFYWSIDHNALQTNHILVAECVSLMNYVWRNNPKLLKIYRTLCILLVRMPIWVWFWLYYNPTYVYPYWKSTRTYNHYLFLRTLGNMYCFFIMYDVFLLWKIHSQENSRSVKVCCAKNSL
jgi:hypothetical protein